MLIIKNLLKAGAILLIVALIYRMIIPQKAPQGKSLLQKEESSTYATELLKPDSSTWRTPTTSQIPLELVNQLCEYSTDTISKANGLSMTFRVPCDWKDYKEQLGEEDLIKQLVKVHKSGDYDILSIFVTVMNKPFTEREKSALIKASISKSEAGNKDEVISYKLIKVDSVSGEQIITHKKDGVTGMILNSVIAKFYYKKYIIRLVYTAIPSNSISSSRLVPNETLFSSFYKETIFN